MPPLELPVTVFGRRVRPVALGLSIWAAAVMWATHQLNHWIWCEWLVIGVCILAIVLFVAGWIFRSSKLEERGLLAIFAAALSNALHVMLTTGWQPRVLVSIAAAVIAAGSYWLERLLPERGQVRRG